MAQPAGHWPLDPPNVKKPHPDAGLRMGAVSGPYRTGTHTENAGETGHSSKDGAKSGASVAIDPLLVRLAAVWSQVGMAERRQIKTLVDGIEGDSGRAHADRRRA